jgi:hypothetical protein
MKSKGRGHRCQGRSRAGEIQALSTRGNQSRPAGTARVLSQRRCQERYGAKADKVGPITASRCGEIYSLRTGTVSDRRAGTDTVRRTGDEVAVI